MELWVAGRWSACEWSISPDCQIASSDAANQIPTFVASFLECCSRTLDRVVSWLAIPARIQPAHLPFDSREDEVLPAAWAVWSAGDTLHAPRWYRRLLFS